MGKAAVRKLKSPTANKGSWCLDELYELAIVKLGIDPIELWKITQQN